MLDRVFKTESDGTLLCAISALVRRSRRGARVLLPILITVLAACASSPEIETPISESPAEEPSVDGAPIGATVASYENSGSQRSDEVLDGIERRIVQQEPVTNDVVESPADPAIEDADETSEPSPSELSRRRAAMFAAARQRELEQRERLVRIESLEAQLSVLSRQINEVELENELVERLLVAATALRDALLEEQAKYSALSEAGELLEALNVERLEELQARKDALAAQLPR